jgi:hypothetical protein
MSFILAIFCRVILSIKLVLPQFLKNTHQNIVNDMDKPLLVQINKLIDQKENYNY